MTCFCGDPSPHIHDPDAAPSIRGQTRPHEVPASAPSPRGESSGTALEDLGAAKAALAEATAAAERVAAETNAWARKLWNATGIDGGGVMPSWFALETRIKMQREQDRKDLDEYRKLKKALDEQALENDELRERLKNTSVDAFAAKVWKATRDPKVSALDAVERLVERVNALEEEIDKLSDAEERIRKLERQTRALGAAR